MKEENIVRKTCRELGVTQKELARILGLPSSTLGNWAAGRIPRIASVALELMINNKNQKTTKDDNMLTKVCRELGVTQTELMKMMGLKASIPVPEKALKNTPSALEPATKEDNIVKKVCRELGITQVELGKMLGVGQSAVATWASGQIPKVAEVAICLMLENKEKDSILQSIKKVKNYLENLT